MDRVSICMYVSCAEATNPEKNEDSHLMQYGKSFVACAKGTKYEKHEDPLNARVGKT